MEEFQDPFNPATQYEQGYLYYKFLTQQIEYKIKCKELEKLSKSWDTENNKIISLIGSCHKLNGSKKIKQYLYLVGRNLLLSKILGRLLPIALVIKITRLVASRYLILFYFFYCRSSLFL